MIRLLSKEALFRCCEPSALSFETTEGIAPLDDTIGQDRALSAIDFGLELSSEGFNIFVLGESGTGKLTTVKRLLGRKASQEPVPSDWCYLFNFKDNDSPIAVALKAGEAMVFQKDMDDFIRHVQSAIPKVFESKEYEKQRQRILEGFQKRQKDLFSSLEEEAAGKGFAVRKTPGGLFMIPTKKDGEPLTEEEYEKLDSDTKKKIDATGNELQEKLNDIVRAVREGEKIVKEMLSRLERETALSEIGDLIEELKTKYLSYPKILDYLDGVKEDILNNLEDLKTQPEVAPPLPFLKMPRQETTFNRYKVNVTVNNGTLRGAPCIFESNPTYYSLFGRIDAKFQYGMAVTDFSMIKAGSLHKANGGYLVMNILDLLKNIFSYDSLKRALRNKEIKIEDIWEQYRLVTTALLKPEPIPLDVKIILIGSPEIYYLLYNMDEEYRELFKVKADFDSRMNRTPENIQKYAAFIATTVKSENLLPFDSEGAARVVEYGSRLADHQEKLSAKFSDINDLIRESHYWATKEKSAVVSGHHVLRALDEKVYRHNKVEEHMQEVMTEGTLIVKTDGTAIGQVNGLAVLDMGDYMFGKPSRITAKTYTGKAGIVNIERETKMSGKIHEKAILIITNYLGSKYAGSKPISLSASITFEQLYSIIEGDSATCAEMYALLSSIAQIPLKQSLAVTGSMDQNGDVQPIGGVNEKIEGFYHLCKARGLDGTHGVIIPQKNVIHLMLKQDVVDAVEQGKFMIYAIDTMEEGLEILTGMKAGELQTDGTYPEGTLNYHVEKRLTEIREALKEKKEKKEGSEDEGTLQKKKNDNTDQPDKGA
ncbi:MAG: Lon protease family protein [bacterium]